MSHELVNGSNQPTPIVWRDERPENPVAGDAYFSPENVIRRDDGALCNLGQVLSAAYDPAKRRPIVLVLPGGYHLVVDAAFWGQPNPDRNGWAVIGDPPANPGDPFPLTLRPSVNIPGTYHGFVEFGTIGANLEATLPGTVCSLCGHGLGGFLVQFGGGQPVHELCFLRGRVAEVEHSHRTLSAITAAIVLRAAGQHGVRLHQSDVSVAVQVMEQGGLIIRDEPGGFIAVSVGKPSGLVVAPAGAVPRIRGN